MSRSDVKEGHEPNEIGAALIAAWYKVLPSAVKVTSITRANPAIVTVEFAVVSENDVVGLFDIKGMDQLSEAEYRAKSVSGKTFRLYNLDGTSVDSSSFDRLTSAMLYVSVDTQPRLAAMENELRYVLSQIVEKPNIQIYFDKSDTINIAVPEVPSGVGCRQQLLKYLQNYHLFGQGRHYDEELGTAILFGCGK